MTKSKTTKPMLTVSIETLRVLTKLDLTAVRGGNGDYSMDPELCPARRRL